MFRAIFAVVFSVVSGGLLLGGYLAGFDSPLGEILGNLGTEVFGILVTIALVDWFLEKRRRQDRGRELAWSTLHSIEHAVWIWQGGPRHLGTDELLGLVTGIEGGDEMAAFTEALLQSIGIQSRGILQMEPAAVKSVPGLKETFEDLVSLATIKEHPPSTLISVVAEILASSVAGFARVLGQPTQRMPTGLIWHRDPSLKGQEKRYIQAAPRPEGVRLP